MYNIEPTIESLICENQRRETHWKYQRRDEQDQTKKQTRKKRRRENGT